MAQPESGQSYTAARMGLGLLELRLGASDATNLSDVLNVPSGKFLHYWFVHVRLRPSFDPATIWPHLYCGQDGSGLISPDPVGQ